MLELEPDEPLVLLEFDGVLELDGLAEVDPLGFDPLLWLEDGD